MPPAQFTENLKAVVKRRAVDLNLGPLETPAPQTGASDDPTEWAEWGLDAIQLRHVLVPEANADLGVHPLLHLRCACNESRTMSKEVPARLGPARTDGDGSRDLIAEAPVAC